MGVPGGRSLRDKAKIVVLFAFCLLNPFAGWAYLAHVRHARSLRPPAIVDKLEPKRLAVLPLVVEGGEGLLPEHDWTQALEIELAGRDDFFVVPAARSERALDPERDTLAIAGDLHADLALDARVRLASDCARFYARLIRVADRAVLWSAAFEGEPSDLPAFRDEVVAAVLTWI